jgi:D-xylose transport system permease protein
MLIGYQIGQIEVNDPLITGIASTYLEPWQSLVVLVVVIAGAVLYAVRQWPTRSGEDRSRSSVIFSAAVYPIIAIAIFLVLSRYFGVPYLLVMLVALAGILTLMTQWTPAGVHVFAVGGNAEAARRAGINVRGLKVVIFALCSALAALAGVVAASRQYSVDSTTGGGDLVLDAIAAAVIGGTSLFGGRGRILGGLLGALVIGSVTNGLDLLGQSADVKTIITGMILLGAVTVDMLARRRRLSSGAAGA